MSQPNHIYCKNEHYYDGRRRHSEPVRANPRSRRNGEGNVVMKASRSEAAREAERADESNLPHARLQGQAPGGRRERPSCGEGDAAGATWSGADAEAPQAFKEGVYEYQTLNRKVITSPSLTM
jgi:hypothetical protein